MEKKKMGRPPLIPGTPKSAFLGLRLDPDEAAELKQAADNSGRSQSEEARDRIFGEDIWLETKWTPAELTGKKVRFNAKLNELTGSLTGELYCKERPDGKRSIRIHFFWVLSTNMGKTFSIPIPLQAAEKLARSGPNQPSPFVLPDVIFRLGAG